MSTNNSTSIFLIDTGADILVIKHNKVLNELIDISNITNINGIGQGLIQTLGLIDRPEGIKYIHTSRVACLNIVNGLCQKARMNT